MLEKFCEKNSSVALRSPEGFEREGAVQGNKAKN